MLLDLRRLFPCIRLWDIKYRPIKTEPFADCWTVALVAAATAERSCGSMALGSR